MAAVVAGTLYCCWNGEFLVVAAEVVSIMMNTFIFEEAEKNGKNINFIKLYK